MAIRLRAWKSGYNDTAGTLTVVQHWSGFLHRRSALVVTVNAQITHSQIAPGPHIGRLYDFRPVDGAAVTEAQTREHLQRLTGLHTEHCIRCKDKLPPTAPWCTSCGTRQKPQQGALV